MSNSSFIRSQVQYNDCHSATQDRCYRRVTSFADTVLDRFNVPALWQHPKGSFLTTQINPNEPDNGKWTLKRWHQLRFDPLTISNPPCWTAQTNPHRYLKTLEECAVLDQVFRHPKSTQHQNPNDVQKVPVGGTDINCPVAFVVVSTSERLRPYVNQKNRATKHMCSMD